MLLTDLLKADGATPPAGVRSACKRGLALMEEFGGPGLTDGAKARARSMAAGESVSDDTLKRIAAFHARHTYEKEANPPSPGYVAWKLWGGDAGKAWANAKAGSDDDVEKAGKGKNGLIGGIGARQWADKEAKRKGKPKAYANAIYSKLTHKSTNKDIFMRSTLAYSNLLTKAEGSRGGHIIGHTKSGKPIYGEHSHMHAARDHDQSHFAGFTKADHHDAASTHAKKAQEYLGEHTKSHSPVFSRDMIMAQQHIEAAHGHHHMAKDRA